MIVTPGILHSTLCSRRSVRRTVPRKIVHHCLHGEGPRARSNRTTSATMPLWSALSRFAYRSAATRLQWNRGFLSVWPPIEFRAEAFNAVEQLLPGQFGPVMARQSVTQIIGHTHIDRPQLAPYLQEKLVRALPACVVPAVSREGGLVRI